MVRRFLASIVVMVAVTPFVSAHAALAPPNRGIESQAGMDAFLVHSLLGGGRIQILDQLCVRPRGPARCAAMPADLRIALDAAIDAPVVWVSHRHRHGPRFVVFAPVVFSGRDATTALAWWDRGAFLLGCRGGANLTFRRIHGAWSAVEGTAWEGCADGA